MKEKSDIVNKPRSLLILYVSFKILTDTPVNVILGPVKEAVLLSPPTSQDILIGCL